MRASWKVTKTHRIVSALSAERRRNLVAPEDCLLVGDAVDVATGRVLVLEDDLALDAAIPIRFYRVYSSGFAHRLGSLGFGFSHSFEGTVWAEPDRMVHRTADGRELVFDCLHLPGGTLGVGDVVSHAIEPMRLRCVAPHAYRIEAGGTTLSFEGERIARLRSIARGPHELALTHDERGLLAEVRGRSHRIRFDHDRGQLVSVRLYGPAEQRLDVARYSYDAEGNLGQVVGIGRRTSYGYVGHLLVSRTRADGSVVYYGYDGTDSEAQCVRTWTSGRTDDRELRYVPERGKTTVVDSLGERHRFEHDLLHRPLAIESIRLEWDDDGIVARRDADGTNVRIARDGTIVTLIHGDESTERFTLDEDGRVIERVDPRGEVSTVRYDSAGRVVEARAPNASASVRIENKVPVELTLGDRWLELEHDGGHRLTSMRSGEEIWQAEYDWLGRTQRVRGPGIERAIERDAAGRVTAIVTDGIRASFERDAEGRLVAARLPRGDWEIEREPAGLPVNVARPDFGAELVFDSERRLCEVRDRRGRRWLFVRDKLGRVVEESDFEGRSYAFRYPGGAQRPIELELPGARRIRLRYDERARLASATHGEALTETFAYDAAGRLIEARRDDAIVRLARGRGGAVVAEQHGEDRIEVRIDLMGRRTMVESSLGARIVRSFGARGERELIVSMFGRESRVVLDGKRLLVGALSLSRAEDRLPTRGGARGVFARDEVGRVVSWAAPDESLWKYEYGVDGLITTVHSPGAGVLRYDYDAFGRRLRTAAADHDARWIWDGGLALHEITSHAPPTLYVFDPDDSSPVGKVQPGGRYWLGMHEDFVALFDEARGTPTTQSWPWRGGFSIDALTGLWHGPGIVFHPGAAEPLGLSSITDELFGPTAIRRFTYVPHAVRLAQRASDDTLADFVHRLTTPPILQVADRLAPPYPEPLALPDLRPRGRILANG